ncbi:MAG: type II toxin-antitoxin system RelE/ParE family toxin [Paludibacteraceae bacterium]|nr:type II toxin-antitoxin system RelE/ParE family toxin [Paludibacteraceae bacterium]
MRTVIWSYRATKSYGKIVDYIAANFGRKRAKQYAADVYKQVALLPQRFELGSFEPLLEGSKYQLRHILIGKLTKIIYRVTDTSIEIADVWDTRQSPEELTNRLID